MEILMLILTLKQFQPQSAKENALNPFLAAIPDSILESVVIASSPEEKQHTAGAITKARLLTNNMEMFCKKIEQKRADEEAKERKKKEERTTKGIK